MINLKANRYQKQIHARDSYRCAVNQRNRSVRSSGETGNHTTKLPRHEEARNRFSLFFVSSCLSGMLSVSFVRVFQPLRVTAGAGSPVIR